MFLIFRPQTVAPLLLLAGAAFLSSCTKSPAPSPPPNTSEATSGGSSGTVLAVGPAAGPQPTPLTGTSLPQTANESTNLAARGKTIYQSNCTACHNSDPHRPGSIGPDLYGSSLELIEARVLRAEYPPGYKPKRGTRAMVALPQLKAELNALHAFLNAP